MEAAGREVIVARLGFVPLMSGSTSSTALVVVILVDDPWLELHVDSAAAQEMGVDLVADFGRELKERRGLLVEIPAVYHC